MEVLGTHNYLLQYGGNFPSVNEMYKVGRARGGRSWVYLDPSIKDFKEWVKSSLDMQGTREEFLVYKGKSVMVNMRMIFSFSQSFWTRDVSNLIKAVEDAVKEAIGIDDRFTITLNMDKLLNDKDNYEYLILVMEVCELDEKSISLSSMG